MLSRVARYLFSTIARRSVEAEVFLVVDVDCGDFIVKAFKPEGYGIYVSSELLRELIKATGGKAAVDVLSEKEVLVYPEVAGRERGSGWSSICEIVRAPREKRLVYALTRAVSTQLATGRLRVEVSKQRPPIGELIDEVEKHLSRIAPGSTIKTGQRRIAEAILRRAGRGGLVIARMPTGYGKTTLLGVLARVMSSHGMGGYGLIVSPLRSMMRDLMIKSERLGLRAAYIDSTVNPRARGAVLSDASRGLLDVLTVTPERFLDPGFRSFVEENPPSFIAIDEAHAAVEWSLSFRPAYLYLLDYLSRARRERLRKSPIVAVSATLSRAHVSFIARKLGFTEPRRVDVSLEESNLDEDEEPVFLDGGFSRDNIEVSLRVVTASEKRLEVLREEVSKLVEWSRSTGGSSAGIVYVGFVDRSPLEWLNAGAVLNALSNTIGAQVVAYHGKLGERERRELAGFLASGEAGSLVIVATKAIGMGVDIKNVRWTLHYMVSDSLEDLLQEIGRAGRDGREARSIVLYNPLDLDLKRRLVVSEILPMAIPLRIYNTVVELSLKREWSGWTPIPLKLAGSQKTTLRGLEKLKEAGLLDYVVSSGYTTAQMAAGGELRFLVCRERAEDLYPLRVETAEGSLEVGSCDSWSRAPSTPIALVGARGKLEKLHAPPEDLFLTVFMEAAWKLSKISEIQAAIEEALRRDQANVRKLIEEFLEKQEPERFWECRRILSERRRWSSVWSEEELAYLVKTLMSCFSWRGVTIAARSRSHVAPLLASLREKHGVRDQPRLLSIARLARLSGRGGVRLSNYGYIVVLADSEKVLEKASDSLERYPFKTIAYLQRSR